MLGQADDLGGGVFKKRLNKNLDRSIILAKGGNHWVYEYLFSKKDKANLAADELAQFRRIAKETRRSQTKWWTNSFEVANGWRYVMKTKRNKFKSDAFAAIHSSATALFQVGAIDKATMRSFDESCLAAPDLIAPRQIKRLRERERVSQPIFARYLNTSESTVEKWESGAKKPSGMALKLLSIVQKHGLKTLA